MFYNSDIPTELTLLRFLVVLVVGAASFCSLGLATTAAIPNAEASSFFFSSRRRHTMSLRDWSSDVCSSDLMADGVDITERAEGGAHRLGIRHAARRRQIGGAGHLVRFVEDPQLEAAGPGIDHQNAHRPALPNAARPSPGSPARPHRGCGCRRGTGSARRSSAD